MHNKFAIFDNRSVWLGSTNLSHTGIGDEYNANVSLIIDSTELANIYTQEFDLMFEHRRFSRGKNDRGYSKSLVFSDNTTLSVYFSPQDDPINEALIPFIENSSTKLDIGIFFLTDERIIDALIKAREKGIEVRIIQDAAAAAHPTSQVRLLRNHSIDVRVENWGGKMHMKAAVSDSKTILIGSMNWSNSGDEINDENTLVIHNNENLAREFSTYFQSLWDSLDFYESMSKGSIRDPRAESNFSINSCHDGLDNDFDGAIDHRDSGCNSKSFFQ